MNSNPLAELISCTLNSNDRFGLKLGTQLAQLGKAAFSSWARCLPRMGRFGSRYLPDTFPFMEFSQRMQFLPSDNSSHQQTIQMEFLLSANHPDSWLTIARWLTICLLEYYNKKPDNLTVFFEILAFTEIQRYGLLLLISTKLN